MIPYLAILMTAIVALFGAPIWAIVPGASILLAISVIEQRKSAERFAEMSANYLLDMAAWQSVGQAVLASGAAYAVGAISRMSLLF
jgi:hypothetical protein